jgi:hypothetical protein
MHRPTEPRRRPLRRLAAAAALAAVTATGTALATIYKCEGDGDAPVYQDEPCPPGRQLRNFDRDPPTVSVLPLGPAPGTSTVQSLPPAAATPKDKSSARAKTKAPARNAGERKFLAPGINEGEVLARIGTPDMKSGGSGRRVARWTYLPAADDPQTVTTLTFDNGRLVEVERKVVK